MMRYFYRSLRRRAVRRLPLDDQQADSPAPRSPTLERANLPAPRSPSPELAPSPVVEEAPASPIVHCSQYRMEEYERQSGQLPRHDKVRFHIERMSDL